MIQGELLNLARGTVSWYFLANNLTLQWEDKHSHT